MDNKRFQALEYRTTNADYGYWYKEGAREYESIFKYNTKANSIPSRLISSTTEPIKKLKSATAPLLVATKEQITKTQKNDFSGILNIGNTCYMNCVIQCLFAIPSFVDFILKSEGKEGRDSNGSFETLKEFYSSYFQKIPEIDEEPMILLHKKLGLIMPEFQDFIQNDAQEFLKKLLNKLSEDLNVAFNTLKKEKKDNKPLDKAKLDENSLGKHYWNESLLYENSIITELFNGQFKSTLRCSFCNNTTYSFELFSDVSLAFPSFQKGINYDIKDLINNFQREETVQTVNCTVCKQPRTHSKKITFQRYPIILVLQLKRFFYKGSQREKINDGITIPFDLILSQNSKYSLFGIIHHLSDTWKYGHYIADCRYLPSDKWIRFDDHICTEIDIEKKNFPYKIQKTPYLLFYQLNL